MPSLFLVDQLFIHISQKKVMEVDTREAQKAGLLRPLVRREIENHCADFGLEAEFVSHNTMVSFTRWRLVRSLHTNYTVSLSAWIVRRTKGQGCARRCYLETTSYPDSR